MSTSPPDRGDVVWLDFDPQLGREQAGRRPALILSPGRYNSKSGLAVACPITRQAKGYPFEVALPEDLEVTGVVLVDQIRCLDWRARDPQHVCIVPSEVLADVGDRLALLLPWE